MGWVLAGGLAMLAFAALVVLFKARRGAWEALAAALVFGLAGFALQARTDLPGAPRQAAAAAATNGAALVEARKELSGSGPVAANKMLVIADGLARSGQFADAAGIAMGAAEQEPGNAEAWLAVANNLVAHADGNLTPAATYAFRKASQADPNHPGPPFFLGLALAQNGQLDEGRAMWAGLLARTPPDAPWRKDLEARIAELDAFIARQQQMPPSAR